MKLNKALKLSLGTLLIFPLSIFVGHELLANHLTERFESELINETLLAGCGGGRANTPEAKAAKAAKKIRAKLVFYKNKFSKMAAAGEPTTEIEAKIAELEALLSK